MAIYFKLILSFLRLSLKKFMFRESIIFHPLQSHAFSMTLTVEKGGLMRLGRNTQVSKDCYFFVGRRATLSIGDGTYFNSRCMLSAQSEIRIGKGCLFGPDVKIYDNNHVHKLGLGLVSGQHTSLPVIVGDGCWIASNVIILKGASIGERSVIGAGCIITGHIPPDSVVRVEQSLSVVTHAGTVL